MQRGGGGAGRGREGEGGGSSRVFFSVSLVGTQNAAPPPGQAGPQASLAPHQGHSAGNAAPSWGGSHAGCAQGGRGWAAAERESTSARDAPRHRPPLAPLKKTRRTSPPSSSTNTSPCSNGDMVPASVFRYGSGAREERERERVSETEGGSAPRIGPSAAPLHFQPARPPLAPRAPIFTAVTRWPHRCSRTPMLEAVTPLPSPLTTPPVTST